ncbi:MAG: PDZ domain-containing protein [Planctomycetes bacterium]|nr:PDZ domain-containing protein [Planctomycetota bacterium]
MAANRLSGLNILLLFVTLVSLALAAYGFSRGGAMAPTLVEQPQAAGCSGGSGYCAIANGGNASNARAADSAGGGDAHAKTAWREKPLAALESASPSTEAAGALFDPAKSNPSDQGDGVITGVVLDGAGKAAADVMVTSRRNDFDLDYPHFDGVNSHGHNLKVAGYLQAYEREWRGVKTDANGKFEFTGLDGGRSYNLVAAAPGRGSTRRYSVAPGDHVTLLLSAEGWLEGVVTTPEGKPADQFTVCIEDPNRGWNIENRTFRSAAGTFRMSVNAGRTRVYASAPGAAPSEITEVHVTEAGARVALALRPAVTLCGVVTDLGGAPLANAVVALSLDPEAGRRPAAHMVASADGDVMFRSGGTFIEVDYTDSDTDQGPGETMQVQADSKGRYLVEGLAAQVCTIIARYGSASSSEKTELKPGINEKNFSLDAGLRLAIRLSDENGRPVDDARIRFLQDDGEDVRIHAMKWREPGLREFAGLAPGTYTIVIAADGYPEIIRKEELKAAIVNAFSYQLPPGAELSGVILGPGNTWLGANCDVRLRRETDSEVDIEVSSSNATASDTEADGSYFLGPVEPGEWILEVVTNWWQVKHSQKVKLAAGPNKLSLTLDSLNTLQVKVAAADGAPMVNVSVWVIDPQGEYSSATTDHRGMAVIFLAGTGEHNLSAHAPDKRHVDRRVNIEKGVNELTVEFKLTRGFKITAITKDSQAERVGLQAGDIVVQYNGAKVTCSADLQRLISEAADQERVEFTVERSGSNLNFTGKSGLLGINGEDAE